MAFDRYAYTFNNPLRYSDPSGHCTLGGHWLPDDSDACQWNNGGDSPPPSPTIITNIPRSPGLFRPDVPGIGDQDGTPGYDGLMALVNQKNAWWWNDGVFTLEEALSILLFSETSETWKWDNDGVAHLPKEVIDAAAYKWQQFCGGGWYTDECFIGFWSYYEPFRTAATSSSQMNKFRNNDLYSPGLWGGDVYVRGANSVLTHSIIKPSDNAPQGWVTIYQRQNEAYEYVQNHSFAYQSRNFGGSMFVVLTVAQQNAFCEKVGLSAMCNLTKAP